MHKIWHYPRLRSMELVYKVIIPGRPYVKKNGAKVFRGRLVYTENYRAWEQTAAMFINKTLSMYSKPAFPITGPVRMQAIFCFENRMAEADLSALLEGPQDVLQKCGVIKNDRQIILLDGSTKVFGDPSPRTELFIYTCT